MAEMNITESEHKKAMKMQSGVRFKHVMLVIGMMLFGWVHTSAQGVMHDTTRVHFQQRIHFI